MQSGTAEGTRREMSLAWVVIAFVSIRHEVRFDDRRNDSLVVIPIGMTTRNKHLLISNEVTRSCPN